LVLNHNFACKEVCKSILLQEVNIMLTYWFFNSFWNCLELSWQTIKLMIPCFFSSNLVFQGKFSYDKGEFTGLFSMILMMNYRITGKIEPKHSNNLTSDLKNQFKSSRKQ
jgi:hypothetical protein